TAAAAPAVGKSARQSLAELIALHRAGTRRLRCLGSEGAFAALCITRLAETLPPSARPLIAVVPDEAEARALRRGIQMFNGATGGSSDESASGDPIGSEPVLGLPDLDTTPWADVSPERRAVLRRMGVLFRLSQGAAFAGQVVVASVRALARRVPPRAAIA